MYQFEVVMSDFEARAETGLRNICMTFDDYLGRDTQKFSKAI